MRRDLYAMGRRQFRSETLELVAAPCDEHEMAAVSGEQARE